MDKEEIIIRLKKISEHAVHFSGEPPLILSLDDGIALHEAAELLKKQEAIKPTTDEYGNKRCGSCSHKLQSITDPDLFCCKCGKPVSWEGGEVNEGSN